MKSLFKIIIVLSASILLFTTSVQAQIVDTAAQISEEQSALLMDSRTQKLLKSIKSDLAKLNRSLKIVQVSTLVITSQNIYAYISLESVDRTGTVEPHGSIVGEVNPKANEPIKILSVFFKPAESLPGGATVGN